MNNSVIKEKKKKWKKYTTGFSSILKCVYVWILVDSRGMKYIYSIKNHKGGKRRKANKN